MSPLANGFRPSHPCLQPTVASRPGASRRAQRPSLERLEPRLLLSWAAHPEWPLPSRELNARPIVQALSTLSAATITIQMPSATTIGPPIPSVTTTAPPVSSVTTTAPVAPGDPDNSLDSAGAMGPLDAAEMAEAQPIADLNGEPLPVMFGPNRSWLVSVPIGSNTEAIEISVTPTVFPPPFTGRVGIFNQGGQWLLGASTNPKTDSFVLKIPFPDLYYHGALARSLFIQFSPQTSTSPSNEALAPSGETGLVPISESDQRGLFMTVMRETGLNGMGGRISLLAPTTPLLALNSAPAREAATSAVAPIGTALSLGVLSSLPLSVVATNLSSPGPIATGPLPTRASAPLGGTLTDNDDAAPAVVSNNPLVEEASPIGPFGNEDLLAGEDADSPAATRVGGAVAALRGPGGFPLLGSLLIAEGRRSRQGRPVNLPEISFASQQSAIPDGTAQVAPATASAESQADSQSTRGSAQIIRRLTVMTGMTVAFAFVSRLVLPDFVDPSQNPPAPRSWLRTFLPKSGSGTRNPLA